VTTYFAQLDDNNIVTDVRVVSRDYLEANPEIYTGIWVETFYGLPNKTYAGIGFIYDYDTQDFYPPIES